MAPLEEILYPAILLDAHSQPIASGVVRFDKSQNRGRFWSQTEQNLQHLLKAAKKLKTEDSTVFDLLKFEHQFVEFPNSEGYFLFEY